MTQEESSKPRTHRGRRIILLGSITILFMGLIGVSMYLFIQNQTLLSKANANQRLVERLGQVIQLPQETPTILTIADRQKLTNAALAAQVQDGDQLLVFTQARQIIVYNPGSQKVTALLRVQADALP